MSQVWVCALIIASHYLFFPQMTGAGEEGARSQGSAKKCITDKTLQELEILFNSGFISEEEFRVSAERLNSPDLPDAIPPIEFPVSEVPDLVTTPQGRTLMVSPRETAKRCAFCHDQNIAPAEARKCTGCGTILHSECLEDAGFCPSLGCQAPKSRFTGGEVQRTGEQRSPPVVNEIAGPHQGEGFLGKLLRPAQLDAQAVMEYFMMNLMPPTGCANLGALTTIAVLAMHGPSDFSRFLAFYLPVHYMLNNFFLKFGIDARSRARQRQAVQIQLLQRRLENDEAPYRSQLARSKKTWWEWYLNLRVKWAFEKLKKAYGWHIWASEKEPPLALVFRTKATSDETDLEYVNRAQELIRNAEEAYQKAIAARNRHYDGILQKGKE